MPSLSRLFQPRGEVRQPEEPETSLCWRRQQRSEFADPYMRGARFRDPDGHAFRLWAGSTFVG